MKKIYILILFLFLSMIASMSVFADERELGEYTKGVDNAFNGQKPITDEEFDKTVKRLRAQKNKKKNKPMKGQTVIKDEQHNDYLSDMADKNIILILPLDLISSDGSDIPIGHYKIEGKKVNNKIYFNFYQSYSLIGTVEATETENDYGQPTINFCKLVPYNEKYIKIIFGSLDFNAYAFVPIKKLSD